MLRWLSLHCCTVKCDKVHPSIFVHLSGAGSWGQLLEQGHPDLPLHGHFLQLFQEDPKAFPGGIWNRCPSHLSWLLSMWSSSGSTPSSSRMTEETHYSRLYPGSYSFGHDPKFMTIGESKNVDWPVNRELRLSTQLSLHHDRPIQRPHYCGHCTDPPVSLTLHPSLTREQDPKILLHLRQ